MAKINKNGFEDWAVCDYCGQEMGVVNSKGNHVICEAEHELDELRAKLAAYEAIDATAAKNAQATASAALKLSALNSELIAALEAAGVKEYDCPICRGNGYLTKQLADGDQVPAQTCPRCDGEKVIRLEDL